MYMHIVYRENMATVPFLRMRTVIFCFSFLCSGLLCAAGGTERRFLLNLHGSNLLGNQRQDMERRKFLEMLAAITAAPFVPLKTSAAAGEDRRPRGLAPLNIRNVTVNLECEQAFSALHISDTHLSLVDNRDNERKMKLAAGRVRIFPAAEHYLDAAINHARLNNMMILHTGDLIDFTSEANLDCAAEHLLDNNVLASAGNHEYSQYVGEALEDEAYKRQSYEKVQEVFPNNLEFCSKAVNGVNFVAIDDVYYNVTERQHELMEKEMKKGMPVVMLCHVPLYTPKHCEHAMKTNGNGAAYVTGAPLSITSKYPGDPSLPAGQQWRNRSVQQRADKPTLEFVKWLKEQKPLKAILCGHCHYFYEERFSPTAMQYIVGANYNGDAYNVRFEGRVL